MKKFGIMALCFGLISGLLLLAAPAFAAYVIDFGNGTLPPGGTISANGTVGTDIPIGTMDVAIAPLNEGVYNIVDGSLDYDTVAKTVEIYGDIPGLSLVGPSVTMPLLLVSGTVSSSSISVGSLFVTINASGTDTKNAVLMSKLGIPAGTVWEFNSLFAEGFRGSATGPYTAISTDMTDIGSSVPIPPTALLLVP